MTLCRRTVRRGTSMVEILLLMPLVGAVLAVTYQVSIRSMRVESHTVRSLAADAARDDLLRRIRDDAAIARTAAIERSNGVTTLTFEGCSPVRLPDNDAIGPRTIRYRASGSQVTRIEESTNAPRTVYQWDLGTVGFNLHLETVDNTPRIVWLSFAAARDTADAGPASSWPLAAAARIGRGGPR